MMNIQAVAGFSWSLLLSDVEKKSMFDVSMVISLVLMYTGMSIPSISLHSRACSSISVYKNWCI